MHRGSVVRRWETLQRSEASHVKSPIPLIGICLLAASRRLQRGSVLLHRIGLNQLILAGLQRTFSKIEPAVPKPGVT
jgi:hypothetical protein